jgi:hypothetical protein
MRPFIALLALALTLLCARPLAAQTDPGNFKAVPFSSLSDRQISDLGTRALSIRQADWQHAESTHFIYHFFQSFIAAPVSVEAEFFYKIIAQELGRETAQWERKCHIFVFERSEDWAQFIRSGKLDPWTGGLCTGGELYVVRDPERKWKGEALGHEVAHLVLYRFFGNGIPLWLNEGFAEYAAARGYASFWRARGYRAKPKVQSVAPEAWIPLARLTSMVEYPSDPLQIGTYYVQSERIVRFLSAADKGGFHRFLEAMAQGNRFDSALSKGFGSRFSNLDAFERDVKDYATREHGTTLQDK